MKPRWGGTNLDPCTQGRRCCANPGLSDGTPWAFTERTLNDGNHPCHPRPVSGHFFQFPDTLREKRLPHCIEWQKLFIE
jgi:hypothetical protein